MRGTYHQVAHFIESQTSLKVDSSSYPITAKKAIIASILFYVKILSLVFIIFSELVFKAIDIPEPHIFTEKLYLMLIVWFVGNFVQGFVTQTGAFEIYKGNTLIWSTLHYGRMPGAEDLVAGLRAVGVGI